MSFTMRGTAKGKVVTSGRLTGGVKAARKRVTPNPGPAACPEPAYSLYSTDSEDQVTSLHKGLDRCAALLTDMLRAEKAEEASPGRQRALKTGAVRSKPSTSSGKKTMKKLPTKTDQKNRHPVQRGAGSTTIKTVPVKLHPAQKQHLLQSHLPPTTSTHQTSGTPPHPKTSILPSNSKTSVPPPQPQTSILPPQPQTSILPPQTQTPILPPQPQTSILPPQPQTSILPPQLQTSIPPPHNQASIIPLHSQASIPPPQPQTSILPPQTSIFQPQPPTSICPPQPQISILPLHPQNSIPPPQTSIVPPQPQTSISPLHSQTSIPPLQPQTSTFPPYNQTSILSPHPQTSVLPPQAQTSVLPPHNHTSILSPYPQTSILPPQPPVSPPQPTPPSRLRPLPQNETNPGAPPTHRDREEDEFIPVRDTRTPSPLHTCPLKVSNTQLDPGQLDNVPEDTNTGGDGSSETEVRVKTVQYLLGELKALIAGQGSVAERLLSHLEQSLPLMSAGGSNIQTEPDLHRENAQLRRRVRTLNQQLKEREKAERQQNVDTLCDSAVSALQEELTNAQLRLQELQDDLTELREALEDTRSQLTDREAQNAAMKTELEASRRRLLNSEQEKSELALLAQKRLEEIENLNRILQSQNSSTSDPPIKHVNPQQHGADPVDPPTDRITQFLMSLEPTHTEPVCLAAEERIKTTFAKLRDTLSHPDVKRHQNPPLSQSHRSDEDQPCVRRLSRCESVSSDWSVRSGSTFNTRDEAAFRDGLAALDASIASLQKSIQLDLGR